MIVFGLKVSQQEYDSCSLSAEGRRPLLIVNCNAPEAKRRFTVIFEPYQSIPNVPEYKTGSTYYYTSRSMSLDSTIEQGVYIVYIITIITTISLASVSFYKWGKQMKMRLVEKYFGRYFLQGEISIEEDCAVLLVTEVVIM